MKSGRAIPFLLALLCSHGCDSAKVDALSPTNLQIAIDVSDRNTQRLVAYANAAYRVQRRADETATVRIYEFAHDIELIYEGPPIKGRNNFNLRVASKLSTLGSKMLRSGTRTHLAFRVLGNDCALRSGERLLVLFTDGGIEDRSPEVQDSLRLTSKHLASADGVKLVIFAGVNQEWRGQWEDWLSPMGRRGLVRGLNDMDLLLNREMLAVKR